MAGNPTSPKSNFDAVSDAGLRHLNVTSDTDGEIDVLNVSASSFVDVVTPEPSILEPFVLPSNVQESIPTASSEAEVIYSSLPPDLNADALARITRTPFSGETFRVQRLNGKLRISMCCNSSISPMGGLRKLFQPGEHSCVVCKRSIADGELYLNFPDDLDRRRVWGNLLGFRYSEVLRMRTACRASLTSFICTDHFTEECFRKFNFNKAAVEAFGMPISITPKLTSSPSKKRSQWSCPICSSNCLNVGELYKHMMTHATLTSEELTPKIRELLYTKGIACPFCRKCTYLYKTISGFNRHLNSLPLDHFYLKRVYSIAKENFRSSVLEPAENWDSWTDRNIYFAYYGCEPPASCQKRPFSRLSSAATTPKSAGDKCEDNTNVQQFHKSDGKRISIGIPSKFKRFNSDGGLEMALKAVYPVKRMSARRILATDDDGHLSDSQENSDTNGPTIADVLNKIKTEDDCPQPGLSLIENTSLRPTVAKPVVPNKQRLKQIMTRKTQRQLESHEARLRLFGDSTFVEIPHGYVKVDTPRGVRLVNANSKTWEEHMAPSVKITNRRFQRVFTYEESRL